MSLEKIKEVKQLSSTNEYVGTPIGCDAENVDMADGSNLEEKLDDIDTNIESVNNEVKEIQDSIQVDGLTITRDDATKVIALAKTLQDKIALVDNKINKANIANNLTTTEADFVLDARQGKALQDQLTTLNGSLNKSHMECLWTGKAGNKERVDFSNPLSNYPSTRRLIFAFHHDEVNNEVIFDIPIFDIKNRTNFIANNTEVSLSIVPIDQIFDTFCYLTWTNTNDYYLKSVYIEY